MQKKLVIGTVLLTLWSASVACAYVMGGSNLGGLGYPEFDQYISYDPSREEVERYVEDAKQYVENCNYDMQRVNEARNNAIDKANEAINNYNINH